MPVDYAADYRNDWRFVPGVVDATLYARAANATAEATYAVKAVREGLRADAAAPLGAAVMDSATAITWWLWMVDSNYVPRPQDAFLAEGRWWVVQSVADTRVGRKFAVVAAEAALDG